MLSTIVNFLTIEIIINFIILLYLQAKQAWILFSTLRGGSTCPRMKIVPNQELQMQITFID